MKRLAQLNQEEKKEVGFQIVPYICELLASRAVQEAQTKRQTSIQFAAALMKECKQPVYCILKAINQASGEQYQPNAANILGDVMTLVQDPDFLALLDLKRRCKVYATHQAEDGSVQKIIITTP